MSVRQGAFMRIKKQIFLASLMLCTFLLSGCGEKIKELTSEEEKIIAMYAAKVVAKHNVRLGQGIVRYRGKEESEEESDTQTEDEKSEEGSDEALEADGTVQQQAAEAVSEDVSSAGEELQQVSLSEALGIEGISFVYEGAAVPETLRLSSYYSLPDPPAGKQYVIASFNAQNNTTSAIPVSIAGIRPQFTASVGGETARAGMVLDQDLMTYEGTIEAGASERLILLFEFSEQAASDLSDFSLTIDINGTKSLLTLN